MEKERENKNNKLKNGREIEKRDRWKVRQIYLERQLYKGKCDRRIILMFEILT